MARVFLISSLLVSTLFFGFAEPVWSLEKAPERLEHPFMYFDLGDVLIDTSDINHLAFMPGAHLYLRVLIKRGYRLGLISNIPEDWGRNPEEKYQALRRFVDGAWRERAPFPWHLFERVILPPNDARRKPHPYMFEQALSYGDFCRPVYQGDSLPELKTAKSLGFFIYLTGQPGQRPFLSPTSVRCIPRSMRF